VHREAEAAGWTHTGLPRTARSAEPQAGFGHATAKRGITHKIKRGWQSFIMVANSAGDCREYKGTTIAASPSAQMESGPANGIGSKKSAAISGLNAGVSNERADDLNLSSNSLPVTLTKRSPRSREERRGHPHGSVEQECFQEN